MADGAFNLNFGKHTANVYMPSSQIDEGLEASKRFTLNEIVSSPSFVDGMLPEEAQRYIQWNKYVEAGISLSDRVRILEISENAPKPKYRPGKTPENILAIPKGE